MSGFRSALLEWDAGRIVGILVSGGAGYLAMRATNGGFAELGGVVLFCVLLGGLWELADRLAGRSRPETE